MLRRRQHNLTVSKRLTFTIQQIKMAEWRTVTICCVATLGHYVLYPKLEFEKLLCNTFIQHFIFGNTGLLFIIFNKNAKRTQSFSFREYSQILSQDNMVVGAFGKKKWKWKYNRSVFWHLFFYDKSTCIESIIQPIVNAYCFCNFVSFMIFAQMRRSFVSSPWTENLIVNLLS